MTKSSFRFGKPAMQRFLERNVVLLVRPNGQQVPIWKRKGYAKNPYATHMWAFYIPKQQPTPQPEQPLVEVEVRDVEASQPGTPSEKENSERVSETDNGSTERVADRVGVEE